MAANIVSAILLFLGMCGMLISITWILKRGNSNQLTYLFISCQLSIVLWLISQLLILFSYTKTQFWISYIIGNIGISFFAPLWLMLSAEYVSLGKRLKKILKLLPLVAFLSIGLITTNPLHFLYYSSFKAGSVEYGPFFYFFQFIYYVCIITGITMICLQDTKRASSISMQSILLILSAAIPLGINTLTLTGILKSKIELTPLFFGVSSILIIIALGRYGLLNINSIAIQDTITNINSGVVIFDINGRLTYKNKYAEELSILKNVKTSDDFISSMSEISGTAIDSDFSSAEIKLGSEYYSLKQTHCSNSRGNKVARVITISNVTEYHELVSAEKKLSLEQERNRIAQEMHDSAGHTFTMISSLARLLKYETEQKTPDMSKMLENISEIDRLSRSGVTQLRCTINNLRDDEFMTSITKAVQTVTTAVRGVETDVCVQGSEDSRYSFCIREMYDNCRETVTNALRYSEATRIDIILKFLSDRVEMYILDNGKGCKNISEHNGLRGIRERTEALGGTVRFSSIKGEGFNTMIKIPLKEVAQ
ncbi:MAG: two-component sensor histidine kinase [Ruminococcus sp.]|uniref:sensor histidine kinase n=1 Tax=Ruminococcus sp. TaxID=41978 RepID=UPI0025EA9286|nr:histidine kinase N-terminal 7TM domain-containing protein [Ruminococcus sp.]MCR5601126.1 two-component sensor histidine kinase [Ruminococcus sp.]